MEVQEKLYTDVCAILGVDPSLKQERCNQKIHKAASVLHKQYIINASYEAQKIIDKTEVRDKYALMISIYNRKIREHQVLVMLIQLFEVAMRTQAAIVLSQAYSTPGEDDWFFVPDRDAKHRKLKQKIRNRAQTIHETITPATSSIDMFNMLTMGDLQGIYKDHWGQLKSLFQNTTYKNNTIVPLHTKVMFNARFERIRRYRNNLFHGNPGHTGWKQVIRDIEDIMVQLQYNLSDTVNNIDPHHRIIVLQYNY